MSRKTTSRYFVGDAYDSSSDWEGNYDEFNSYEEAPEDHSFEVSFQDILQKMDLAYEQGLCIGATGAVFPLDFLPAIYVDGIGQLSFPLINQLEILQTRATDPNFPLQIPGKDIAVSPKFGLHIRSLVNSIKPSLGFPVTSNIKAELDRMVICTPQSNFNYSSSKKPDTTVGTLVIQLPCYYEGGSLTAESRSNVYKFSHDGLQSRERFFYSCFRKECNESRGSINKGTLVTLRYHLLDPEQQTPSVINPHFDVIRNDLEKVSEDTKVTFLELTRWNTPEQYKDERLLQVLSCVSDKEGNKVFDCGSSQLSAAPSGVAFQIPVTAKAAEEVNKFQTIATKTYGLFPVVVIWSSKRRFKSLLKWDKFSACAVFGDLCEMGLLEYAIKVISNCFQKKLPKSKAKRIKLIPEIFNLFSRERDLSLILDHALYLKLPKETILEILSYASHISPCASEALVELFKSSTNSEELLMACAKLIENYGICEVFCSFVNKLELEQQKAVFNQISLPLLASQQAVAECVKLCKTLNDFRPLTNLASAFKTYEVNVMVWITLQKAILELNLAIPILKPKYFLWPNELCMGKILEGFESLICFGNTELNQRIARAMLYNMRDNTSATRWKILEGSPISDEFAKVIAAEMKKSSLGTFPSIAVFPILAHIAIAAKNVKASLRLAKEVLKYDFPKMPVRNLFEMIIEPVFASGKVKLQAKIATKLVTSYFPKTVYFDKESSCVKRQYWLSVVYSIESETYVNELAKSIVSSWEMTPFASSSNRKRVMPPKRIRQFLERIKDPDLLEQVKESLVYQLVTFRAQHLPDQWERLVMPLLELQTRVGDSFIGSHLRGDSAWQSILWTTVLENANEFVAERAMQCIFNSGSVTGVFNLLLSHTLALLYKAIPNRANYWIDEAIEKFSARSVMLALLQLMGESHPFPLEEVVAYVWNKCFGSNEQFSEDLIAAWVADEAVCGSLVKVILTHSPNRVEYICSLPCMSETHPILCALFEYKMKNKRLDRPETSEPPAKRPKQ